MKIKRVLLVVPPDTRPPDMGIDKVRIGLVAPLGLAYIAAVLEQNCYEVFILDCAAEGYKQSFILPNGEIRYGLSDEAISSYISFINPDLVGVSCLFSNKTFDAHNVCKLVKAVNPEIITIMGGSHPTALPEETLQDKNVNGVVKGEGELALLRILQVLNHKEVEKQGKVNTNTIPFPARHLLNMDKYLSGESAHSGHKATPSTNINSSRGCPGRCQFCAIRTTFGDAYRTRSPENVLAEIDHLVNTYHIKELDIEDDNFSADKKRAMAILQGIIDRKYNLYLNSPSGLYVNSLDEELLNKMKEAGYYSISLAIESGVPRVLKLMGKHVDLVKAKRLVKYGRSIGLKVKTFWICGYPGETKDDMKASMQMAYEMGADWNLSFVCTPLPGTPLLKTCQDNGYLVDPNLDYRRYFYTANVQTKDFTPDDVMEFKEKFNLELNFIDNINLREGKFDRAQEDFQEVLDLYPDLEIAKEGLRRAENGI